MSRFKFYPKPIYTAVVNMNYWLEDNPNIVIIRWEVVDGGLLVEYQEMMTVPLTPAPKLFEEAAFALPPQ